MNSITHNNIQKLSTRERGEWFTVNEQGEIKTMGVFQRIFCILIPSYHKKQNRQLKSKIDEITSQIQTQDTDTKKLFFETLAPLSRKVYGRVLHNSVITYLTEESGGTIHSNGSEEYKEIFQRASLWARLGNFKRPEGGVGGSYAIRDGQTNQILGIYKPSDEDTLAKNNPYSIQKVKRILAHTLFRSCSDISLSTVSGQGYLAEAAATVVAKYVSDTPLVPETQSVQLSLPRIGARDGSFQLWVNEGHQSAAEFFGTSRQYQGHTTTHLQNELFDYLVIVDYITGNFDRHGDNWLILNEGEGIRLIDGGWSMAPSHPTRRCLAELRNHYLWKRLPQADTLFTHSGRAAIDRVIANQEILADEIRELYAKLPDAEERINRMQERIQVLNSVKESRTKKELAEIRTAAKIRAQCRTSPLFAS